MGPAFEAYRVGVGKGKGEEGRCVLEGGSWAIAEEVKDKVGRQILSYLGKCFARLAPLEEQ